MRVYINDDEFMLYRMETEPYWRGQPALEISAEDYAKYQKIMDDMFEWQKRIESLPRSTET